MYIFLKVTQFKTTKGDIMTRTELEYVLGQKGFSRGGTQEACIKVRDFLKHANGLMPSEQSCVTAYEFIQAVQTLMAFAVDEKDTVPKKWRCSEDCHRVSHLFCPGECKIDPNSDELCPFYMDSGWMM